MKTKNTPFVLTLFALSLSLTNTHAQLYNGNAFLKNDYIQMALSGYGVYGAWTTGVPPGYYIPYNASNNSSLAFIAAPDGNWSSFYGDYLLPGDPYEAFSLTFNDSGNRLQYINSRTNGYVGDIISRSPAFVYNSNTGAGEYDDVTWYGEISGCLEVDARFQLVGAKVVHYITIKNVSSSTLTDIYFARGMDPDQESGVDSGTLPSGCYPRTETYNVIESQANGTPGKPSWVAGYGY
jgi:hypothetical protein